MTGHRHGAAPELQTDNLLPAVSRQVLQFINAGIDDVDRFGRLAGAIKCVAGANYPTLQRNGLLNQLQFSSDPISDGVVVVLRMAGAL